MTLPASDHWLLSYYRASEIQGALFFGRVARLVGDVQLQAELTRQFADEARHADLFTRCLHDLGAKALALPKAYQDGYLEAAGVPAGLVDVLALTHVFERRVMLCYAEHLRRAPQHRVAETLRLVMLDERQHVAWTKAALDRLARRYGREEVDDALARYRSADAQVHGRALDTWREALDAAEVSP